MLEQVIFKLKTQNNKSKFLTDNIDKVIIEIAEIFSILSYELRGQNNISKLLKKVDNYFEEKKSMT